MSITAVDVLFSHIVSAQLPEGEVQELVDMLDTHYAKNQSSGTPKTVQQLKNEEPVIEVIKPHSIGNVYTWKITDKYGAIVAFGVTDEFVEFDLEKLPDGWSGERCLDDIQKTMEKQNKWKEDGLQFEYTSFLLMSNLSVQTQTNQ